MQYQRTHTGVPHPKRATQGSAGLDLTAQIDTDALLITPGGKQHIPTGIHAAIPDGHVGLLFVRSSIGVKRDLVLANGTGIIDSDYRGEIIAVIRNTGHKSQTIHKGERIAQLVITPCWIGQPTECDLDTTHRADGGFGSTGTH